MQELDQLIQVRLVAEADLALAEAQLVRGQTNLGYATILSPVSGVIVDRAVDVGQTVAASFQTPVLFKIAQDLSKMQIDSSFAEADIGHIQPGQEVVFTVDAFPDREFPGVVKQIRLNPTTQQNVVTYDVVVLVENKDHVLLPGMTAYVNIKTAEHKDILLVPNAALRFHPPKAEKHEKQAAKPVAGVGTVYRWQHGKLVPVTCSLGATDNRNTILTSSSLAEGTEVVVGEALEDQKAPANAFRFRMI